LRDSYRNPQMVRVTGPNQELAIKLIKRMKALFTEHGVTFDSKETVLELSELLPKQRTESKAGE
jgi:hypothetical protein